MDKKIYIPIYLRPFLGLALSLYYIFYALMVICVALFLPVTTCFHSHLTIKVKEKDVGELLKQLGEEINGTFH